MSLTARGASTGPAGSPTAGTATAAGAAGAATDQGAEELHRRYAPTSAAFTEVHSHCRIVWDVAASLLAAGAAPEADVTLVRTGALLHDIGVYRLYDDTGRLDHAQYLRHGVLGHELLAAEGLPRTVCRFASCHTGVGLTRAEIEAGGLPVPAADYLAETVEERLVMYADKFHSKSRPGSFLTAEAYRRSLRRFGTHKIDLFDALTTEFGLPDLPVLATRHHMTLHDA
ncbi:HD domain-containing protein [Frankia sp. Ag45/Mut15]|uniref:HD domain-containing protein n=1 Tax=Frankia umida TaxID=573489 RepID=A0ABT0K0J2_9ACTN|nr:HD domain-containing protein [Frankia umida]MCK9877303.1 HD domain-containing protein [Frankia umida]